MRAGSTGKRIRREEYKGRAKSYFRTAEGTRPDLMLVEIGGEQVIIKDFNGSDRLFRFFIAPVLVGRERKALIRLSGVQGIPQFVADIDRYAFAMEYAPGKSLDKPEAAESLTQEFFEELKSTVTRMHEHGVAHCDLRSWGNVIAGDDGRPYVIDFAASVLKGRGLNPLINWLFGLFVQADDNAVLRIKRRVAPQLLTSEDEEQLAKPLPFEGPAVAIGGFVRKMTRRLTTRRRGS